MTLQLVEKGDYLLHTDAGRAQPNPSVVRCIVREPFGLGVLPDVGTCVLYGSVKLHECDCSYHDSLHEKKCAAFSQIAQIFAVGVH